MAVLAVPDSEISYNAASWMFFFSSLSTAFADVIVDSMMVIQARRYPRTGSEELNAFSYTWMALGGLLGSIIAAFLTENFEPRHCFAFSSLAGVIIAITATQLNVSLETLGDDDQDQGQEKDFWNNLKRNIKEIK